MVGRRVAAGIISPIMLCLLITVVGVVPATRITFHAQHLPNGAPWPPRSVSGTADVNCHADWSRPRCSRPSMQAADAVNEAVVIAFALVFVSIPCSRSCIR